MIEYISSKDGVEWVKMEDICDDFKKNNQPVKGALLPAEHGAIAKDPSMLNTLVSFTKVANSSDRRPSASNSYIAHEGKQGRVWGAMISTDFPSTTGHLDYVIVGVLAAMLVSPRDARM